MGKMDPSLIGTTDTSNEGAVPREYKHICYLMGKCLFFDLSAFLDNLT